MNKIVSRCLGLIFLCLPLAAQTRVQGRLTGPDGRPIAGAVVAAAPEGSTPSFSSSFTTRSDADGRFILQTGTGKIQVTVTAAGFRPGRRSLELKSGERPAGLDLRLERGGIRVRGSVRDAEGRIPEDIRLAFLDLDEDGTYFTDAVHGEFNVFLETGPYFIMAEASRSSPLLDSLLVKGPEEIKQLILAPEATPAGSEVRRWIKAKAVPLLSVYPGRGFEDLEALKNLIGDASVVGLGEATHGTSEFFRLKHRLIEFLAERMGFSVVCVEASLVSASAINDYVLTGQGDPSILLGRLGSNVHNTEEFLSLIKWLRIYNRNPLHRTKIKFYGFDMNNPLPAYAEAKDWLERNDPDGARFLDFSQRSLESPERTAKLKSVCEQLIARLDARKAEKPGDDDSAERERQRQNLRLLIQWGQKLADPFGGVSPRDKAMAENVRWICGREPGAKLIVWAHNSHVGLREGSLNPGNPMGWHLRKVLGSGYVAVGFTFREGGFSALDFGPKHEGIIPFSVAANRRGTLDEALASAGADVLALDLRRLPKDGPERAWFERPQGSWHVGSIFREVDTDRFIWDAPAAADYDAIVFVAKTSAAVSRVGGRSAAGAQNAGPRNAALTNLGFEDGQEGARPPEWLVLLAKTYEVAVAVDDPKEGRRCLRVKHNGTAGGMGWMNFSESVDAASYQGKKIRLTAWIRTDGKRGNEGRLWVRADLELNPVKAGLFDNMEDRPIISTKWTKAVIEGVVDREAKVLSIGGMAIGTGTVWFDGFALEIIK